MRHASRLVFFIATATALNACAQPAQAPASVASVQSHEAASTTSRIQTIASGLEHPWAVALLPEGGFLVSERPGRLRRIAADGSVSAPLSGLPTVFAQGQGGLLDVVLDPQYPANKRIWFTYAEPGEGGTAGTAAATATLAGDALVDLQVIYRQQPKLEGGLHFGSRLAFDHLVVTVQRVDEARPVRGEDRRPDIAVLLEVEDPAIRQGTHQLLN